MRHTANVILATLIVGAVSVHAAAPNVTAISPQSQAFDTTLLPTITVTFDTPVNPASVTVASFRVFGRWSGVMPGTLSLHNGDLEIHFDPAEPFFAGEWVTVSLSRAIASAGGDSLTHGYQWNYWTPCKKAVMSLVEIDQVEVRQPEEGHVQTYGTYAGDFNDDGWSDLAVPNEVSNDVRVFFNDGTGGYGPFSIVSLVAGSYASTNEGADFDNDGDLDFAVGAGGSDVFNVLSNDGTGALAHDTTYTALTGVRGLSVMDLDGDGWDDVVVACRVGNALRIFLNKGDGSFFPGVNVEANCNGETACAAADANNDGILDLFVGCNGSSEISLMLGDGEGGLTYSSKTGSGGASWLVTAGDMNGDGNADVLTANSTASNVGVVFGNGSGGLSAVQTYITGGFVLSVDAGDIDGDGDLDVASCNYSGNDFGIFTNNGMGTLMNRVDYHGSSVTSCVTIHDRDNDGDMDVTGVDEIDDLLILLDNPGCCSGMRGNVNGSAGEVIDISDLTYLVAFMFKSGQEPVCMLEANVNGVGPTDIADLTYLVKFMFAGGPSPTNCPL